jgi:antitoxin component YwqK of YwqJK toxin-antitoxin module
MKRVAVFLLLMGIFACGSDKKKSVSQKTEALIERKDGVYYEWYPGKKQLKFKGALDTKGQRMGKWVFYSESGNELSITLFENGLKEGFSIVKYPNGRMHYRGEYLNDEMVGTWTTYAPDGKLITEKNYPYPNE